MESEMTEQEGKRSPNPGSEEAGKLGCLCPVMDNGRGSDEIGRIRGFVMRTYCPLHGSAAEVIHNG